MKKITLLILLFSSVASVKGQQKSDVLFLKNGSVINGNIITADEDVIKIESCCGNIFVLQNNEIDSIGHTDETSRAQKMKHSGYMNYTSFGVLIGSKDNQKDAPASFLMEHNYIFNTYIAAGLVTGIELLNEAVIPVGANLKGFLPLSQNTIFIGISGGYMFSIEDPADNYDQTFKANGGTFASCEIGISVPVNGNSSIFAAFGYRHGELNYNVSNWWTDEIKRTIYFNRFQARVGLSLY